MTDSVIDTDFDSKYGHLTRPLKEAALCWDINLEDVIDSFLSKENDESFSVDPAHMMNFAQAGMLVSSTAINYGRKVEHLYTLVYSTLDSLSKGEGKSLASSALMKKMRKRIVGFQEFENGFELLDEQFKQPARGIDLGPGEGLSNGSHLSRRVPLLLLPREDSGEKSTKEQSGQKQSSNGTEFKTSGCFVSAKGCLLLDPLFAVYEDWDKLGEGGRGSMGGRVSLKGPLVPGAVSVATNEEPIAGAISPVATQVEEEKEFMDLPSPMLDIPSMEESEPASPEEALFPRLPSSDAIPVKRPLRLSEKHISSPPAVDLFKELDPHSVSAGRNVKMKVGKCHKTPPELKTIMELFDSLETMNVFQSKRDLFGPNSDLLSDSATLRDPSEKLPLVNTAPFTSFKAEFEMELREIKRKASQLARERKKEEKRKQAEDLAEPSEDSDEEAQGRQTADDSIHPRFSVYSSRQSVASAADLGDREAVLQEPIKSKEEKALQLERERTALLEKVLESSKRDYDELMRKNLFEMNSGGSGEDHPLPRTDVTAIAVASTSSLQEKIPELYANIRKWQDNLEPLLEEQSARPVFDLDDYLVSIIGKLKDSAPAVAPTVEDQQSAISEFLKNTGLDEDDIAMSDEDESPGSRKKKEKGPISSFESLVKGEPKWNVCRLFLSTLILTNNGNVEIFNQEQSGNGSLEYSVSPKKRYEPDPHSPRKETGASHTLGASQSFQVKLTNADKNFKFAIQDNAAVVTGIPILTNKDLAPPEPVGDVPFAE